MGGKRPAGPDAVFWRWLELQQKLRSAGGADRVLDKGLVFAERCPSCKSGDREERLNPKTGASAWFCGHCSAVWPVDIAHLLKHEIRRTRRPQQSQLHEEAAELSIVLAALTAREVRAYLLLYLYENVGGYDRVAEEMNKRFPRTVPPGARSDRWSEWNARNTITVARSKIVNTLAGRDRGPALFGTRPRVERNVEKKAAKQRRPRREARA